MRYVLLILACACCDGRAEDDTGRYEQQERRVWWPAREEVERWPRDEAQCDGEAESRLSVLEHMCSVYTRCDAMAPPLDYWIECMRRRGHDVRKLDRSD